MGSQTLLMSLYRYKSWADDLMLDAMIEVERAGPLPGFGAALRILNHAHIVDRIFMAHLEGRSHGYDDNEPDDLPALKDLSADIRQTDSAYVDYIAGLPAEELRETVRFGSRMDSPDACRARKCWPMSSHMPAITAVRSAGFCRRLSRLLPWTFSRAICTGPIRIAESRAKCDFSESHLFSNSSF
ncbi:DinB family protein [Labrys sp. KB_33_2]|uniref:DinB family protein n=1 Tax=Labrys sp. KB_33_2 TaxID=3237479 RepID=UPI003F93EA84